MHFQAAIFDMDGLLLDTERVCMRVFKAACEQLELPFDDVVYRSMIGCNAVDIQRIFTEFYGDDYQRIHDTWRPAYNAVVLHEAIPVKTGVLALLDWLKAQGVPMAVATSTSRDVAEVKLELAGLTPYFDSISTGDEVKHGKPHPEIYLLAAERLGVDPTQCIAFEDSNNGTRAAMAAGMQTFQIPDLVEPSDEVRALGHIVLPSMEQVLEQLKQAA
ncbi:Phosphorylated carbohydrates phosphatase [Vibrio stylophorae]|uniref:Phosphorylated carbohydrates phosphatase n=1 Tax=Vibrio stylophorae TaxID=659351 RepID=A0ABM8ZXX0_9VIBR|nr:HAD family phosphatase [Vibrio stylophorae]CAH0535636.1 Phosphorylated carbohydrates phosphatase [Vibrio stylophorae]